MSYTRLNYHVTFSTKDRRPLIEPDLLDRTCRYLGGMIREMGGVLLKANGQPDHLHLAVVIPAASPLADFIGKIKSYSTGWIHRTFPKLNDFAWQNGYAAFTVSPSVLDDVICYIDRQREHHAALTFEQELMKLLDKHGIEYDPAKLFV